VGMNPPNQRNNEADGRADGADRNQATGVPRQPNGPSTLEMLLSPSDTGEHESAELTEAFWFPTEGLFGPVDPLQSDPDQEGPPGTANDDQLRP
jgi:hypothetical protein